MQTLMDAQMVKFSLQKWRKIIFILVNYQEAQVIFVPFGAKFQNFELLQDHFALIGS